MKHILQNRLFNSKLTLLGIVLLCLFSASLQAQPAFSGNLAQRYIYEGDNLMKVGDFNGAILAYTNAINSNISYGDAYVKRSIALKLVGRWSEGKDDLDKALRISPQYMAMYDSLTTKGMKRDSLSTLSNPYENININALPEDTAGFINMAVTRLESGDYKEATHYLKGYLSKHPADTLALVYAALAYTHSENYDTALTYIKRLVAGSQNFAIPYNIYGLYYYKQGYYIDAIDKFNKAIQVNPNFSIAYFNRGLCKKMLGNERNYTDDFEKAMHVDQRIPNMYFNRGYYEKNDGDNYSAQADYKVAAEGDKLLTHIYFQANPSKKLQTDYYSLFNSFTASITKTPTDADGYYYRANFLMLFGEYTPAVIDYNKAVNLSPQNADYIFNRGIARILKTDANMGCRDLKKSFEMGIDSAKDIIDKFCR